MTVDAPRPGEEPGTMLDALDDFESRGFHGQFVSRPGGVLLCTSCHEESDAADVALLELRRYEGTSDPGDEAVVAALECPRCEARGTIILTYGPMAPPEDHEVFRRLEDDREDRVPEVTG